MPKRLSPLGASRKYLNNSFKDPVTATNSNRIFVSFYLLLFFITVLRILTYFLKESCPRLIMILLSLENFGQQIFCDFIWGIVKPFSTRNGYKFSLLVFHISQSTEYLGLLDISITFINI